MLDLNIDAVFSGDSSTNDSVTSTSNISEKLNCNSSTRNKPLLPMLIFSILNRSLIAKGHPPRSISSAPEGVTVTGGSRWGSHIWDCGKQFYLGGFDTAHTAARAYDRAAIKFRWYSAFLPNSKVEIPSGPYGVVTGTKSPPTWDGMYSGFLPNNSSDGGTSDQDMPSLLDSSEDDSARVFPEEEEDNGWHGEAYQYLYENEH